ncbi:hypothetical protein L873DRAFT_1797486 [Choiromyces venosus 120613-1]|uniref:Uncharacterized protein n=1 Tax=Choiromyces venosus 120613-1 TaxID=1336337 RepID=A0A3N4KIT2_9PEZI|nr:hypothetical protein L873DRAFT_1797486 [Choiromyces venosus 120613-1]
MTSLQQLPQLPQSQASIPARRRTYLTDENKLALVKLCVENQADFQERRKGQFWMMISGLLEQEIGVSLKDPAGRFVIDL